MDILLVNPPHPSIGSRIPREHLPPLGLLSVGGPLIDAGHEVQLLDAELGPMSIEEIVEQEAAERQVIQTDVSQWDYKHQVLATRYMPPGCVLLWVKLIEACMQLRPRSLWRFLAHPDPSIRDAMHWYYQIGRQVWPYEIRNFLFRDQCRKDGPTLAEFWGASTPA